MASKAAREHHYVPRFILRRWAVDHQLHGYYWDEFKCDIRVRKLGVGAFCHELDLLSLASSGVASDVLESRFFGYIDDEGAKVAEKMVRGGPGALTPHERPHFARLLMSLEARWPLNVAKLKREGAEFFADGLNSDPEIVAAVRSRGILEKPSDVWESLSGSRLEDRALLLIQNRIDNPQVGTVLINAHWRTYPINERDGSLILGDRPLIRVGAYDHVDSVWALPLTPRILFVAANSRRVIENFDRQSPRQLCKRVNGLSINQLDRYAFLIDESNFPLVSRRLSRR